MSVLITPKKDVAHDFRHIQRIVARLDRLTQELPRSPQKAKLYFLASFHGLIVSLRQNETFLSELNWTQIEIEEAFQSLERHLENPQTLL